MLKMVSFFFLFDFFFKCFNYSINNLFVFFFFLIFLSFFDYLLFVIINFEINPVAPRNAYIGNGGNDDNDCSSSDNAKLCLSLSKGFDTQQGSNRFYVYIVNSITIKNETILVSENSEINSVYNINKYSSSNSFIYLSDGFIRSFSNLSISSLSIICKYFSLNSSSIIIQYKGYLSFYSIFIGGENKDNYISLYNSLIKIEEEAFLYFYNVNIQNIKGYNEIDGIGLYINT